MNPHQATDTGREHSAPGRAVIQEVTIRFAGDSGDGIQVTGSQFTGTTALAGNDIATLPDYPAEIRAPAGTLPGVSGFQLQFSSHSVLTPGDQPDVLVAFNPAALKVNLKDLKRGGILVVNKDAFEDTNLKKAGYSQNPLDDDSLGAYRLFSVEITRLTRESLLERTLFACDELAGFLTAISYVKPGRSIHEVDVASVRKKIVMSVSTNWSTVNSSFSNSASSSNRHVNRPSFLRIMSLCSRSKV